MDYFTESEKIYSSKTREYFREVVSSYANGNYRSAIVMLYSVCLCDLLFKLEELRDMYSDATAKRILNEIEKEQKDSKSKSSWEKVLIDMINDTELLGLDGYTNLLHLRDNRNLSAHPALNDKFELILPKKEVVAACIRTSLDTILLNPPIYIKNVINVMTDDLDGKKSYILADKEVFKQYVSGKYLDRMPIAMRIKVFRAFWKFVFRTVNSRCDENRNINTNVLELMFERYSEQILADIKENNEKYEIRDAGEVVVPVFRVLSKFPTIYANLSAINKTLIKRIIENNVTMRLLSWFTTDKKTHLEMMISKSQFDCVYDTHAVNHLVNSYRGDGLMTLCAKYLINVTSGATSYYDGNKRLQAYIEPYVQFFAQSDFELMFELFNKNSQIYRAGYFSNTILPLAARMLPPNYTWDTEKYSNIDFSVLEQ